MNKRILNSLPPEERFLLSQTDKDQLRKLDEDELIELHSRIRRARNKHVGVYRRKGAGKVAGRGGRGKAKQTNQRNADRAEVYEEALSRVSRALAKAANESAKQLRDERIAAARGESDGKKKSRNPASKKSARKTAPKKSTSRSGDRSHKSPVNKRSVAGQRSSKARSQAKRDSR